RLTLAVTSRSAQREPRSGAASLRQQRVAPILNHDRFHQALEDERVLPRKGLGLRPRLENGHVSSIRKRLYAQDDAPRNEFVHDPLVARIDGHDRIPAGARGLADDDGFHEIPPELIAMVRARLALPLSTSTLPRASARR